MHGALQRFSVALVPTQRIETFGDHLDPVGIIDAVENFPAEFVGRPTLDGDRYGACGDDHLVRPGDLKWREPLEGSVDGGDRGVDGFRGRSATREHRVGRQRKTVPIERQGNDTDDRNHRNQ